MKLNGHEESEVRRLVQRAHRAWPKWNQLSWDERSLKMLMFANEIERCAESYATQICAETNKPIRYARAEVEAAVALIRFTTSRGPDQTVWETGSGRSVRRRSLGCVALVTPWNNPMFIPVGKFVPAMMYGNCVVWKPALAVGGLAGRLVDCFRQSGESDALQLVTGGDHVGQALMNEGLIAAVSLTGASVAGQSAQSICARRNIPLQAELGGNNASIVWSDADLDLAARLVSAGAFCLAGQRCTANRRVIVEAAIFETFLTLLTKETAQLTVGEAQSETTEVGPMISNGAYDRIESQVDAAARSGLRVVVPHASNVSGQRERLIYPPTIVCCDDPTHQLVQEESFGPILVVQKAEDWEHAIDLLNGVRQGLAAALFSTSARLRDDFLARAEAGVLKLNQSTAGADLTMPFGGWKSSGIGPPEHGSADVEFYTRFQSLYEDPQQRFR